MGKLHLRIAPSLVLALVMLLTTVACSEDDTAGRERTREFVEGTLSIPPETSETPGTPGTPGTTLATGEALGSTIGGPVGTGGTVRAGQPDAVLRLEGDPETTFSGNCTAGAEVSVIGGQVPKRYRFDLNGQELSCRIQKRNPGSGSLRVVLLSGNNTRSVQQTNSTDSVIRLSHGG